MAVNLQGKDPDRVAAGLKGAINNPNNSEEARANAAQKLETLADQGVATALGESTTTTSYADANINRVLGGHKATLHNDNSSEQAKLHSREILEAHGFTGNEFESDGSDEHHNRVLGGYKAALNNPKVSDGAKKHAEEYLKQHNAL